MQKNPFTKSNKPHDTHPGEIRDTKYLPKHSKDNLQQTNSSIKLKGKILKAVPLKLGTQQGYPITLSSSFQ